MEDKGDAPAQAKHLHVTAVDDGRPSVTLELPAAAARNLADLFPPEVAAQIRARGVDLDAIVTATANGDLSPRVLLESTEGVRHVRVWLE